MLNWDADNQQDKDTLERYKKLSDYKESQEYKNEG